MISFIISTHKVGSLEIRKEAIDVLVQTPGLTSFESIIADGTDHFDCTHCETRLDVVQINCIRKKFEALDICIYVFNDMTPARHHSATICITAGKRKRFFVSFEGRFILPAILRRLGGL